MDRLSAMALLVKVTELGSMSAAARALNMPLTTVSRHIGELESALGVRLLARTTRKLTLTDAGVDYVAAARRILEEVENAERQATGEYQEPKGELVISAPTMFGRQHVLPVISEFIARYPLIRVRLLLSDRNADLVSDHVDLAVRIGDLADSSMVATRLGTMRIVACAHPALLAKYGEPQRPRDLATLPIIRIESPMPYRGWRFRAAEREDQLINLPPVLSVTTPESAADAARLGVGVARGVTMHGIGLNVDPDLEAFSLDRIIPCGIDDAGVTSLAAETGRHLATSAPADALVCALENHLSPLVADAT